MYPIDATRFGLGRDPSHDSPGVVLTPDACSGDVQVSHGGVNARHGLY